MTGCRGSRAEAGLTHASGVSVPPPPAVPVWPGNLPGKEAAPATAEGCPPPPPRQTARSYALQPLCSYTPKKLPIIEIQVAACFAH